MTDLQLGLIIGGIVIIIAVYGLNRWQEFRYKKMAAKAFAKNHPDVLLHTPKNRVRHGVDSSPSIRYEPSFTDSLSQVMDAENAKLASEHVPPQETISFIFDTSSSSDVIESSKEEEVMNDEVGVQEESLSTVEEAPNLEKTYQPHYSLRREYESDRDIALEPSFYFIAEVTTESPIEAATMPIFSAAKRVRCLGLRADQHWELVTESSLGRYNALKIGLQLVDRQGPVTAEDIDAFCQTIQLFATESEAKVIFPLRLQKIDAAVKLDQFCASTDMQVAINLRADVNLSLKNIAQFAETENMVLSADGAFHRTDENGNTLFCLINQFNKGVFTPNFLDETRLISFVLDVPRVVNGAEIFDQMCALAVTLGESLGAELVDDNHQILTQDGLAFIRRELIEMQKKMQAKGIVAGSTIARQLYS